MPDIIKLLPDSIANQIAAGEVIQRPASVVKELLENSIDAGATAIRLIVKDAGKTSLQVIDDGAGMSETDARMAFERHATSKIRSANDLFCIKTMGFRGEALASIAAIAQVELTTRTPSEEVGTRLMIEGSEVKKTEKNQAMPGTSITVKNLFYNVPARRKFLKSDPVEFKHILDEFHRVALANPDVFFSLHHNGSEVYHLPKANLMQRITGIMGKQYSEKLIPVSEDTDVAVFSGFIGKPDTSKKSQGEQYLFVNKRFIRSNYLNHAVRSAYEDLISKDVYPSYFIFFDVDPANIDINIHPTKTEIKFEDERLIYNYLRVALKHSLGQYSLMPMLDFSVDHNFNTRYSAPSTRSDMPEVRFDTQTPQSQTRPSKVSAKGWEEIYSGLQQPLSKSRDHHPEEVQTLQSEAFQLSLDEALGVSSSTGKESYQLHNAYIIHQVKSGMMVIDQQAAHERILYEQYLETITSGEYRSQKELFPRTVELEPSKTEVLKNILSGVNALGFDIEHFGHNTFVINGTPPSLDSSVPVEQVIDGLVSQFVMHLEFELGTEDNLARSMAISSGIKRGKKLEKAEMSTLIDLLFACRMPEKSPTGRKCFIIFELEDIAWRFMH